VKVREASRNLIVSFLLLLTAGILLTSTPLITVSFFPLFLLLIPTVPSRVRVERISIPEVARVGEEIQVEVTLRILGFGIVKIMHILPEVFELSEGVNVRAIFVLGTSSVKISYRCIPLKRGNYDLGKLIVESDNLMATSSTIREVKVERRIEVRTRVYRVKRIELRRGIARKPMPEIDISSLGTPGTEFREIRKYTPGDAFRFINWKATAKLGQLMVNEFEREGRKSIWIFLDANPYMRVGTVLRNCYDAASELAASICYFFTVRGYKVGLCVVGHNVLLYPESGKRQFRKVIGLLSQLDVSENYQDFVKAVNSAKKYIDVLKPGSIFITRVEWSNPIRAVIKAMGGLRKLPVTVIDIKPPEEESIASRILQMQRQRTISRLMAAGVDIIELEMEMKPESIIPIMTR
jgi:uncharacterized protein (DUF58 family)